MLYYAAYHLTTQDSTRAAAKQDAGKQLKTA